MIDLTRIFESVEKLAYDILIWTLLVPKTLVKILVEPGWVTGYVTQELQEKEEARFDAYLSPVILLLIVSLLPYLFILIAPYPGVEVGSSADFADGSGAIEIGRVVEFWADPDFRADTGNYTYEWHVEDGQVLEARDNLLVATWDKIGDYGVLVMARNDKGESYEAVYRLFVRQQGESIAGPGGQPPASSEGSDGESILDTLEGEAMLIPALIFLGLPMFFAVATEAFRGYMLTRSTLRRSFHIQCYYFAPFILVMWSLFLGEIYFVLPRELLVRSFGVGIAVCVLLWLIRNETNVIYNERGLKNKWGAIFIILACIAAISGISFAVSLFLREPELLRQSLEWIYMLTAIGIVLSWALLRRKRKASPSAAKAAAPTETTL